jgi:hypothetical protein
MKRTIDDMTENGSDSDGNSDKEVALFMQRWTGRGTIVCHNGSSNSTHEDLESSHNKANHLQLSPPPLVIDRPLVFRGERISFDSETKSRAAFREIDWYYHILDRYLEAGYSTTALVSVFRGIPSEVANVLKESLQAIQILRTAQLRRAETSAPLLDTIPSTSKISACPHSMFSAWEMQQECGYLSFEWYPDTQVPERIHSNTVQHFHILSVT